MYKKNKIMSLYKIKNNKLQSKFRNKMKRKRVIFLVLFMSKN